MKFNYVTRIRLISLFIFAFALLIIGRLYFLQIVDNDYYLNKADRQYSSTAQKIFSRGNIYFQNKDKSLVSAATLQSGFIVAVNPEILKDAEFAYKKLNEIFPTDKEEFMKKAEKKNDPYEEIAVRVPVEIGEKIEKLKIPGLQVHRDRWRFYPGGQTAAHVIGMLGFKGNEFAGRYGLERQYEQQLLRKDGGYVNFFAEIFSNLKAAAATTTEMEADLVTTIEPTVQMHLQNLLASTTEKWNSEATGGIIMDPRTGEIYAMEVYPTFDPNHPEKESSAAIFSNPLIENVYEVGSIIKSLTIAAGIDAGVITAKSTYYDNGYVIISGKKVSNFDGKERGMVTMQDVLSQSLNVGAAYVKTKLGNDKFRDYMLGFGLGEKTGIDLPNEGRNLTNNLNSKIDIDLATASFGQGIAMTPITTIRALAALANGGSLVKPHVVKSINYKLGISKDVPLERVGRVIRHETSEEVSRMMVYSVDHVLMNGSLKLENHSVAAKTGTAQIAKPGGGGYYDDKFLHSFVGYFPAYNPQFIILLYTLNPKGAQFGSETLTSPFMDMVKFLINYYEVPPDR